MTDKILMSKNKLAIVLAIGAHRDSAEGLKYNPNGRPGYLFLYDIKFNL